MLRCKLLFALPILALPFYLAGCTTHEIHHQTEVVEIPGEPQVIVVPSEPNVIVVPSQPDVIVVPDNSNEGIPVPAI